MIPIVGRIGFAQPSPEAASRLQYRRDLASMLDAGKRIGRTEMLAIVIDKLRETNASPEVLAVVLALGFAEVRS